LETVDLILSGGTVLTMNDAGDIIEDGAVAIQGARIVTIGKRADLEGRYTAKDQIDCRGRVILPGLVNAHTHVPMTLLRALADDLRLDVWLMGYIMPVEREFVNPAFCRLGTQLACAEMIRGGTTTFADMYYFESDIAETTEKAGLRALLGETILKFPAPDAATYEESFAITREFVQRWKDHPRITPTIAPHAPYSNTEETLRRAGDLAREFDLTLMIHIAETRREVEDNIAETGKSVVPWMKDVGLLPAKSIMAHCVHVDEHEMRIMQKHDVSVAHCPSANLKLASGIAPVMQMMGMGINVALGTDGPASNNDLDLFEEMRLAALLAKVTPSDPTALPAKLALRMATRGGAKALRLENSIGSLEVGKLADMIVVETDTIHNTPHFRFNPDAVYSQLVYAAKSSDVQHTICHGQILMRDRKLLTVDDKAIRAEVDQYADAVGRFITEREGSPLTKLVGVAVDVERAESFEVQVKAHITDPSVVETLMSQEYVEVINTTHYRQYDTYFMFANPDQGRVRYREDDKLDLQGNVTRVRQRLTYTTDKKERVFNDTVVLSHSHFIAPASHPLRFYLEYFQASTVRTLQKERRRWRLLYKGVLYFVNIDKLIEPTMPDFFIEIKSRTWSAKDAEQKAQTIHEMMEIMGIPTEDVVRQDYPELQIER